MKPKILFIGIIFLSLFSCKNIENPFAPPPQEKKANIVLDGDLKRTYTTYDRPQFEGYVKNNGTAIGYNCMVAITCYSDANKTTIIDTANGFPANLGNIGIGEKAYFDAVAFNCKSHEEIKAIKTEITWLDRD